MVHSHCLRTAESKTTMAESAELPPAYDSIPPAYDSIYQDQIGYINPALVNTDEKPPIDDQAEAPPPGSKEAEALNNIINNRQAPYVYSQNTNTGPVASYNNATYGVNITPGPQHVGHQGRGMTLWLKTKQYKKIVLVCTTVVVCLLIICMTILIHKHLHETNRKEEIEKDVKKTEMSQGGKHNVLSI